MWNDCVRMEADADEIRSHQIKIRKSVDPIQNPFALLIMDQIDRENNIRF